MRQLERILGPDKLQEGLQAYLKQFQFGNATWLDLVHLLDERTDLDLAAWSRAWVEEAGRPSVRTEIQGRHITLIQPDARWIQQIDVLIGSARGLKTVPVQLQKERTDIDSDAPPQFVLPTGGGVAYGDFALDEGSRTFLLTHLPELKDPLTRGAAWVTLWEELLDRRVRPQDFMDLALRALPQENTEQNVQLVLGYAESTFWSFLSDSARDAVAPRFEQTLRSGIANSHLINDEGNVFLRVPIGRNNTGRHRIPRTRMATAGEDSRTRARRTRRSGDGAWTRGAIGTVHAFNP